MKDHEAITSNHYVVPDTGAMRRAKDRLNMSVSDGRFDFLPSSQEKLLSVSSDLNDAHQQLFEDVKKITALLANSGLEATLASIEKMRSNTVLSALKKDEHVNRLLEHGVARIAESQIALVVANNYLARVAEDFVTIRFAESTIGLRRTFDSEVNAIEQRIGADEGDLGMLKKDKQFIDDAIQKFKAPGWRDIVSSLLPSAEEIEAAIKLVATGKPDKEFLKLVLNKLQGNFEALDQGRQFTDLAQARDAVRDRMSELNDSIKSDKLQVRELQCKLGALDELGALDSVLLSWSEQVAKVAEAYSNFLRINNPKLIVDVPTLKDTAERYDVFLNYLKSIKKS
ncbi:hypothetical protein C1X64_00450 [Pseudomonas sp. GW456-E7]|nr:hypothetical protein C1X64_00450 [Pseudomonas sp. GW456-E7]